MKKLYILLLGAYFYAVILLTFATPLEAQTELSRAHQSDVPLFHFDIVKKASLQDSSLGQLDITTKIAYDELQFTKGELGFNANYEITVVIYDDDKNQVDGTIWQKDVAVQQYEMTNSRNDFSYSEASFQVEPGEYEISVGLTDMDSRQKANKKESIIIPDYLGSVIGISDIIFARSVTSDSLGNLSIIPEVTDATSGVGNELFAIYEVYTDSSVNEVNVFYEIIDPRDDTVFENTLSLSTHNFRTPHLFQLDIDSLTFGKHILHMEIKANEEVREIEKMFNVRWVGLPATVSDLELAIEQIRYIADKKEYKKMKKAESDEKLQLFKEFWQLRDPTPGTEANEEADEHYRRVQYANDNFTVFRDGWKTDMGMLYIILGPPNEVDRNPYPLQDKPYEIWYYYKINYDFVFYDDRGYGEYRLMNAYSLEELLMLRKY